MHSFSNSDRDRDRAGFRKCLTALLIALLLLAPLSAAGEAQTTIFMVTSTASSGPSTLSQAIQDANSLPEGSSCKIIIEVPGTLPGDTLRVFNKTCWIKGRRDATLTGFICEMGGGASLTIEDLDVITSNATPSGISVSDDPGVNALYLSGFNSIYGINANRIIAVFALGILEIDHAPGGSDLDDTLTVGGVEIGISGYESTVRMKGGTVTSAATIWGVRDALSVTGGKLIAQGDFSAIRWPGSSVERITISGGTVVARGILRDIESGNRPLITGGSVDARTIDLRPTDASDRLLYRVVVTVGSPPVKKAEVSCSYNGGAAFSAYTDSAGKLYFWMPSGEGFAQIDFEGTAYGASGTVAESDDNQMTALESVATEVVVSPAAVGVNRGSSVQFSAVVEGEHLPPQDVIWTVENGHAGTSISDTGLLTISGTETAQTLIVTATSAYDQSKSGEAEVTLVYGPLAIALLLIALLVLILLLALLALL